MRISLKITWAVEYFTMDRTQKGGFQVSFVTLVSDHALPNVPKCRCAMRFAGKAYQSGHAGGSQPKHPTAPWKFKMAPEELPSQKERIVFQSPHFSEASC